jgi:hypothetical protein
MTYPLPRLRRHYRMPTALCQDSSSESAAATPAATRVPAAGTARDHNPLRRPGVRGDRSRRRLQGISVSHSVRGAALTAPCSTSWTPPRRQSTPRTTSWPSPARSAALPRSIRPAPAREPGHPSSRGSTRGRPLARCVEGRTGFPDRRTAKANLDEMIVVVSAGARLGACASARGRRRGSCRPPELLARASG